MSVTVCIPARLRSTRLERKLLADVGGRPLLERTHAAATRAECGEVLVLVDSEELRAVVEGFGGTAVMTDPEAESGTARIASVADEIGTDVVVNLQGDAPLTDPAVIAEAGRVAARTEAEVTMPVYSLTDPEAVHDPSVVKVVRAADGRTLYCSRSAVPHVRGHPSAEWPAAARFWGHIGLYAYKREFLLRFGELPAGGLEEAERLEQLRWLEAGVELHTFEAGSQGPSVDTQAQLEEVREIFASRESPDTL
jgi:3-deoxy-manno-octulosonate cytidylyltransferase (CMP-KDO synthetase)